MNFFHILFSLNFKILAALWTNLGYRIIRAFSFREIRYICLQEACSTNDTLFHCGLSYGLATVEYTRRQLAFLPETSFVNIPLI